MRFAVKSTTSLMLECAEHFENKRELDKAIQLYVFSLFWLLAFGFWLLAFDSRLRQKGWVGLGGI